ncbi:MAG: BCCT family transporter, partial [Caldilineaceae bacterium]|nr:BCCT family transporter [Caldilineaceae bacterium]
SAGMGIGLLFYGVAEPVLHFSNPPLTAFSNPEAAAQQGLLRNAQHAMGLTFLHWGLHAWGIYAVIGLGLAYVGYNRKMGLSIGAFLKAAYPRIPDLFVDVIDVLAITATVCGVAASLGFGATQINAGLGLLAGVPDNNLSRSIVIFIITMLATISVALGLDKGIRRLSEVNMVLAIGLALFVLIAGPTVFLLDSYVQNIGYYLQRFVYFSTWTEAYSAADWQSSWTIFYWGWWIAWSPFVGMFIARISRGRTIREFIIGVLLVPTLVTFVWLAVFGNAALFIELRGAGGISEAVAESVPKALYATLAHFPASTLTSILATLVIITFFVTSSDSGSLVIDVITAGGHANPPIPQRVFWGLLEGAVAAVLLVAGGLRALQLASLTMALPFSSV